MASRLPPGGHTKPPRCPPPKKKKTPSGPKRSPRGTQDATESLRTAMRPPRRPKRLPTKKKRQSTTTRGSERQSRNLWQFCSPSSSCSHLPRPTPIVLHPPPHHHHHSIHLPSRHSLIHPSRLLRLLLLLRTDRLSPLCSRTSSSQLAWTSFLDGMHDGDTRSVYNFGKTSSMIAGTTFQVHPSSIIILNFGSSHILCKSILSEPLHFNVGWLVLPWRAACLQKAVVCPHPTVT